MRSPRPHSIDPTSTDRPSTSRCSGSRAPKRRLLRGAARAVEPCAIDADPAAHAPFPSSSASRPASSRTATPSASRLVELRAGLGAGDDPVGLLRHRARDLAAERLDHLLGVLAGQRRQRAGEDEGLARERQRHRLGDACALGPVEAGREQRVDDLLVVRLGEEGVHALGDDRARRRAPRAAARARRGAAARCCRSGAPGPWRSSRRRGGCPAP